MYYSYQCPQCGRAVWEYEDDHEAEYDAWQKLSDAMKTHYRSYHPSTPLSDTDEELRYRLQQGMMKTPEKPTNAA